MTPATGERSVETVMLVDETGVPEVIEFIQSNQRPSIQDTCEPMDIESIEGDFGRTVLPMFVEEPETMEIESLQTVENQNHLHSSETASNSESVSQAMEVDSKPIRVSRFDQKPYHPPEIDEIATDEETSTNDSRSPSIAHQLPDNEITRPSVTRRVTFAESTQTQRIMPILRSDSLPSLQKTNRETSIFDDEPGSPETSPISAKISRGIPAESSAMKMSPTQNGITAPIAYHGLSNPTTVLLTNTYDEWSNFCVGLGADGNIDLVDTRLHSSAKGRTMVWSHEYTGSCAINGAWISPGELALVDKDCRRNRENAQITLVKYMDTEFSTRPQITPLRKSPHSNNSRITAITPLWIKGERRSFATGGIYARHDWF